MARVTIEDCLEKGENRFILIHMAAKRVRQFKKGDVPLIKSRNREVVTALREIAAGKLIVVPRHSEKETSPAVKKEVDAESPFAPMRAKRLHQTVEDLTAEAKEDQSDVGYDEANVLGKAVNVISEESPY